MIQSLTVCIGYDTREITAFHVLVHSLMKRASAPVRLIPIALTPLQRLLTREPTGSTQFSISRFLTPALCDYQGYAVYMDCDMVVRCNLVDLLIYPILEPDKAVWVVQHAYLPKTDTKMWGAENKPYPRKNWSSLMLMDCTKCDMLTPEYVNQASPMELHRFQWLSDAQMGCLPLAYNHLVGEYRPDPDAKIYHYTLGTPNLEVYRDCDHADLWWHDYEEMITPCRA